MSVDGGRLLRGCIFTCFSQIASYIHVTSFLFASQPARVVDIPDTAREKHLAEAMRESVVLPKPLMKLVETEINGPHVIFGEHCEGLVSKAKTVGEARTPSRVHDEHKH